MNAWSGSIEILSTTLMLQIFWSFVCNFNIVYISVWVCGIVITVVNTYCNDDGDDAAVHGPTYFLRLPPALEDKYVSIDVFNTNPTGQRQSGVSPNPIHHRPQLRQEGNQTKPGRGEETRRMKKLRISIVYLVKCTIKQFKKLNTKQKTNENNS